jgi:hypothetical protein
VSSEYEGCPIGRLDQHHMIIIENAGRENPLGTRGAQVGSPGRRINLGGWEVEASCIGWGWGLAVLGGAGG